MIGELGADGYDYWGLNAKWMTRSVMNGVLRKGEHVVLLHDGGGNREATVAALPMIIDKMRAAGFRFVTTHELVGLPRSALMVPRPTGSFMSDAESGVWRVTASVLGWLGSAFPYFAIGTALLGMLRLGVIALLALVQSVKCPGRSKPETCGSSIAVLVPAYNEEKTVAKTVHSLLSSTLADRLDIIVIDDGSTDRTAEVVRTDFAEEERVRLLEKANGGKASALNFGLDHTNAEIIVAIDGDTVLMPDAIEQLIQHFNDPSIGAVAGNVIVGNPRGLMARFQSLEYITSQNLDRRAFQLMNAIGVVPGAIGAWRHAAILQAGGYKNDTLAEDAELTLALLRNDWRIITEPAAQALTEVPETLAGFMKQRYRWMFGTLQVA